MNYSTTQMRFRVFRRLLTVRSARLLTRLVILAAFCISVTSAHAQNARLMGAVTSVQEDGREFEQYTVKCGTVEERKLVRRQRGDDLWCGKLVDVFCAENRVEAAHLVCSPEYFAAIKEQDVAEASNQASVKTDSARIKSLESELLAIQSELLEIESKKLDLRNQDLKLLRRAANL